MTDKEMLELAAKAYGVEVYESTDGTVQNRPVLVFSAGGRMGTMPYEERWNPLQDDGQAFRLAVKLDIQHHLVWNGENDEYDTAVAYRFPQVRHVEEYCGMNDGLNIYAATRRAITRAAAEIGKGME